MCCAALAVMTYFSIACLELLVNGPFNDSLFVTCLCTNLDPELPSSRGENLQTKCLHELYGLKVILLLKVFFTSWFDCVYFPPPRKALRSVYFNDFLLTIVQIWLKY